MKTFLFIALSALFCERINAFAGIRSIFAGEDKVDDEKREILEFALRSMELGMDLDKQAEIDKKAFELRGESSCAAVNLHCKRPKLPKRPCIHGYNPVISVPDETGCSCVESYQCCPKTCSKLTDDDWKLCENRKKYGIGLYYPFGTENCCDCPIVLCMPCPKIVLSRPPEWAEPKNDTHRYFWCENKCDIPVEIVDPLTKCPDFICQRRPPTTPAPEKCDSKCHEVETKTDECGYNYQVCKCRNPPQCTPEKPKEIACHTIEKVKLDVYACDPSNEKTCMQCYQWKYSINEIKHISRTCQACEMEKVKDLGCGSFETTCTCRKPRNCLPSQPEAPPCHKAEKVINQDSSMCDPAKGIDQCQPCFHWNFVPEKYNVSSVSCNENCEYKRPISKECGSAEQCVCIGKSKQHCQPDEPTKPQCYNVTMEVIEGSFMCDRDSPGQCSACHTWEYQKEECPPHAPIQCKQECQTEGRVHRGCDCYKRICRSTKIPECRPPKPTPNPDCFHEPRKEFRKDIFSYDETTDSCVKCYNWDVKPRDVPDTDECPNALRQLPTKCVSDYTVPGKCNSLVKKCRTNHLSCTEVYSGDGEEVCPRGNTKVTLKTSCGGARDACVDCKEVAEQMWMDPYDDKCYTEEEIAVLGKCPIIVKKKKECPRDQLIATECPLAGRKRRVFYDDCNCPYLKCCGCPTTKHLDLQLILDSSTSITENMWIDLLDYIKSDFLDSIFTVKDSQLAVTRFGTNIEILQELAPNVKSTWFDDKKYEFKEMGFTHTAQALQESFTTFDKGARWNDGNVIKAVIVITDSKSNDPELFLTEEVKKWTDRGAKTYALGFGNEIKMEELQKISSFYAVKVENLDKLKQNIMEHLIPNVCEEAYDANYGTNQ